MSAILAAGAAVSLMIFRPVSILQLLRGSRALTMTATTDYSMAFVTVPNMEVGKNIAGKLVSGKLAACVNIVPGITSVYEWEGKIENDQELLLMIKTRTSRIPELVEEVKKNHPYDVCEVITSSIEQGNQPYLDWLGKIVPEKSK